MGAIDADQHIHEPRTMWRDYADSVGTHGKCVEGLEGTARAKLFEENVRWLVGAETS